MNSRPNTFTTMKLSPIDDCLRYTSVLGGIDNAYWIGEAIASQEFSQIDELTSELPATSKLLVQGILRRHIKL